MAIILCSNFSSLWFVQDRCHRSHVTDLLIVLLLLWSSCVSYSIVEEQPAVWSPCFLIFFVCAGCFFLLCERWQFPPHDTDVLHGSLVPLNLISLFWKQVESSLNPFSHLLWKGHCVMNNLFVSCLKVIWDQVWLSILHSSKPKSVFAILINWNVILNRFPQN